MEMQALEMYRFAKEAHEYLYTCVLSLRDTMRRNGGNMPLNELADLALAFRETVALMKDCEKELRTAGEEAQRRACLAYIQMESPPIKIKTEYVSAEPDMRTCASVPRFDKEPEEYAALMDWLGIDTVLRDTGNDADGNPTAAVAVHWPGFQSLCTRLSAAGYGMPAGIDQSKTYTQYFLKLRRLKPLEEEPSNPF